MSTGAGFYRAGGAWAGFGAPSTPAADEPLDAAPAYDPYARTVPFTSDGAARAAHWVDQTVAVLLGLALGAMASRPDDGVDIEQIRGATDDNRPTVLADVVNRALRTLLAKRAISIQYVHILSHRPGSDVFEVGYKNLVAPGNPDRTFRKAEA